MLPARDGRHVLPIANTFAEMHFERLLSHGLTREAVHIFSLFLRSVSAFKDSPWSDSVYYTIGSSTPIIMYDKIMTVLELQGGIADIVTQPHKQDMELDKILTALLAKATLLEFSERDPDLLILKRHEPLQKEVSVLAQIAFQYLENPVPRGYYARFLTKSQQSELGPSISSSNDPKPEFPGSRSSLSPAPSSAPSAALQHWRDHDEYKIRGIFDVRDQLNAFRGLPRSEQTTTNYTLHTTLLEAQIPSKRSLEKVVLTSGHSPLDWVALTQPISSTALAKLRGDAATFLLGLSYLGHITPSQLKHRDGRKGKYAWTVYQGKVYNISAYLDFHPGGRAELLKGAGRSSDELFTEAHSWVNWDEILRGCKIGILVGEDDVEAMKTSPPLDSRNWSRTYATLFTTLPQTVA